MRKSHMPSFLRPTPKGFAQPDQLVLSACVVIYPYTTKTNRRANQSTSMKCQ